MRKKSLTIATIILALCMTACGGSGSSVDIKLSQAPDYSKYTHRFDPYAYSGPSDGKYKIDGEVFDVGEDFRTKERLKEYQDAGFSIWFPQNTGIVINGHFNETIWLEQKYLMDDAHDLGLKVILCDTRLQGLSRQEGSLIGTDDPETEEVEEYQFASEEALDAYIGECIALYKDHPAFYGLMLTDEPRVFHVTAFGQMYRAMKRVMPDKFIQYNLLPVATSYYDTGADRFPELTPEEDNPAWSDVERALVRYEKYLNMFLDEMPGVEYLQFDDYPIHPNLIDADYLPGLQIAAKVCAERNIELHVVSQTFGMRGSGPKSDLWWVGPSESDLYWMNNILLGFGVKQIHYFTYWTKADNSTTGEYFVDGCSFITRSGDKTELYYSMQKILAENQNFAPVIKQFAYQGSKSYAKVPLNFDMTQVSQMDNSYEFKKVKNVEFEKEIGIVTELYDSENDNYLYMMMNALGSWNEGSYAYQTNTIQFSDEYTHVVVYKNGVGTPQKLGAGNTLTVELAAGEAVFLLPY